jgi:predicted small lipoprotein YifL
MMLPSRVSGEHSLALFRRRAFLGLALGSIVILGLAGCGRKSGLDPPPSAAVPRSPPASTAQASPPSPSPSPPASAAGASPSLPGQDVAAKTGFDAQGNPVAGSGQKKSFILDFLLQ